MTSLENPIHSSVELLLNLWFKNKDILNNFMISDTQKKHTTHS